MSQLEDPRYWSERAEKLRIITERMRLAEHSQSMAEHREKDGKIKAKVLGLLPSLSQSELKEIVAALRRLGDSEPENKADPWQDAIAAALGVPLWKLDAKVGKHLRTAEEFLQAHFAGQEVVVEVALRRFLVDLVVADMRRRHVPLSGHTVAVGLGNLSQVFDNAFPGWRASGLVGMIVAAMTGRG